MTRGMVEGLLLIAAIIAGAATVIGGILYWYKVRSVLVGTGRRLHVVPTPPPSPFGRPIERIAADARRLRTQLDNLPPGLPVARLVGWRRAYEDVLIEGCLALGIDDVLTGLPPGTERDAELLRVEYLLEDAGLHFRDAS